MKVKLILMLVALSFVATAFGQNNTTKRVAILETIDKEGRVSYGVKLMVRSKICEAITNTPGYEGYDRVDVASIMSEHDFQRTGLVSDSDIKRLGEMSGAQYILFAEVANIDVSTIIITAKVLDVETARLENTVVTQSSLNVSDLQEACNELVTKLFGKKSSSKKHISHSAVMIEPNWSSNVTPSQRAVLGKLIVNMVKVEGGTFTMGATKEQGGDAGSDEKPVHQVTLTDFHIGKYEVTQAEWEAVMGHNPSKFEGNNKPVEQVTWNDCQEFIYRLNSLTGLNFCLPTEAQWEYAARGGNRSQGYKYSGSNNINNVAWYYDNSGEATHEVGLNRPNELGLYDMSGNVYEWCSDWYGDYSSGAQTNPTGPSSGSERVLRGGGWYHFAEYSHISIRLRGDSDEWDSDCGFRLALPFPGE